MQPASPTPNEVEIPDLVVNRGETLDPYPPEVPMSTVQITMEEEDPLLQLDLDSIADETGASSVLTSLSPDTRQRAYPPFHEITTFLGEETGFYSF